jgi:hypothetical protein
VFERPATTHLRCPDCKSDNLFLIETGTWTMSWEVAGGAFDRSEGYFNSESVDRIEAECRDCKRHWKPRKAWQIDDVCKETAES